MEAGSSCATRSNELSDDGDFGAVQPDGEPLGLLFERRPQLHGQALPDEGAGRDQNPRSHRPIRTISGVSAPGTGTGLRVAAEVHHEARPAIHDDVERPGAKDETLHFKLIRRSWPLWSTYWR